MDGAFSTILAMILELYGLRFDAPGVTISLASPWRATTLEQKLFDSIRVLPRVEFVKEPDELHCHITDAKGFQDALTMAERILKGWQEEASDTDTGDRRSWRWLIEADVDSRGQDHSGESACIWAFLRLTIERENDDKLKEDVDLNGLNIRFWRADEHEPDE